MQKKIFLLRNDYSKTYNAEYNELMKSVSDDIFQTQKIFPAGYTPVGNYNFNQLKHSANPNVDGNITEPIHAEKFDITWSKKLSQYEQIIASHLLYGSYNSYIFSGGMGSGKTSTASHVLNFIKEKFSSPSCAFIDVSFDFNRMVVRDGDNSAENVLTRFKNHLYDRLRVKLINHISVAKSDLIRRFLNYMEDKSFDNFEEFFDLKRTVNNLSWLELTNYKRAETFLGFIEKDRDKIERIEMMMKFLFFLKKDLNENEFIIIFYDNIDVLEPFLQNKIFNDYILPLNEISQCKCLISLRRITFHRQFNYNDIDFAHSFGFIHHHGHQVSDIITERLAYWLEGIESDSLLGNLNLRYKEALKSRIAYLLNEFKNNSTYSLRFFLNSLAGNSIRLGLYMCNRLLINNIIKYDESPSQRDRYKKALLVDRHDNMFLSKFDEVINLFESRENFSLIRIYLLKIISGCNDTKERIKIKDLMEHQLIKKVFDYEVLVEDIQALMYPRRPLIWIDKVNNGSIDKEANLYITEIGDGYINYLLDDLTYIQECFMSVMWDSNDIPVTIDIQNEFERLWGIIKCLKVAIDMELSTNSTPENLIMLSVIEKTLENMFALNFLSKFKQIRDAVKELITYLLNFKNLTSVTLTNLLLKIEVSENDKPK